MNNNQTEDSSKFSPTVWDGQLYNVTPYAAWSAFAEKNQITKDLTLPSRTDKEIDVFSKAGIIKRYGSTKPEVVVIGDSHALMWSGVLDQIFKELNLSAAFWGADGTPTFFPIPIQRTGETVYFTAEEKFQFDRMRLKNLDDWKPKLIIISARWSTTFTHPEIARDLISHAAHIGSKIIFIGEPPELFFGSRNAPQYLSHMKIEPAAGQLRYVESRNAKTHSDAAQSLTGIIRSENHCKFIPVQDLYLKDNDALAIDGFDVLYIDDNHLSHKGAERAKTRIKETISAAL